MVNCALLGKYERAARRGRRFPKSDYGGALLAFLCFMGVANALVGQNIRPNQYLGLGNDGKGVLLNAATVMLPADLTPAVDKFVRLPESDYSVARSADYIGISADGPAPEGPDPFKICGERAVTTFRICERKWSSVKIQS